MPLIDAVTQERPRVVVRLSTNMWTSGSAHIMSRTIRVLRRKSTGPDIFTEDIDNTGIDQVFPRILNLDTCEDGVYEMRLVNPSHDWESGSVDDWDYQLIPYTS